jgi:hypothetical protein
MPRRTTGSAVSRPRYILSCAVSHAYSLRHGYTDSQSSDPNAWLKVRPNTPQGIHYSKAIPLGFGCPDYGSRDSLVQNLNAGTKQVMSCDYSMGGHQNVEVMFRLDNNCIISTP